MPNLSDFGQVSIQDAPDLNSQLDSLMTSNAQQVNTNTNVKDANANDVNVQSLQTPIEQTLDSSVDNSLIDNTSIDDNDEINSLITRFKQETGYEGEVELKLDGFIKVVNDVKESYENKYKSFNEDEEIRQFVEHKAKGGTLDTFKTRPVEPNLSHIREQLTIDNIQLAEQLVRTNLQSKGLKPIVVEATINALKDTGELHTEASEIVDADEIKLKEEYEANIKTIEEQESFEKEQAAKTWEQVNTILKGNTLNGFTIRDAKELQSFKEAVLPNPKTGESKIINMRNELTIEQQLFIDYMIFKGFNLGNVSIQGAVQKPQIPKNDLSLSMLSGKGGKANVASIAETDNMLNDMAGLFNK